MKQMLALGTAGIGALPASAAILNLDLGATGLGDGITLTSSTNSIFVDLDSGVVAQNSSSTNPTSSQIRIKFSPGNPMGPNYTHAKAAFSSAYVPYGGSISFASQPMVGTLIRYSYGQSLNQGNQFGNYNIQTESPSGVGQWGGFTGVAFVGFRRGQNEGWVALDYQAGAPGGSVEVLQVVYGNANEELTTPTSGTYTAVPEPASAGALLAGAAAIFALRRRRKS